MSLFTRGPRPRMVDARGRAPRPRRRRCPSPSATSCSARRSSRPFPEGLETAVVRHGLLLGRRAHVLAGRRASTRPRSATPAATRRTRPTRRSARGRTGHTEAVLVVFDPAADHLRASCCSVFWESHDPTQGMRQGNDVGTQYRSAIYYDRRRRSARRPRRSRDAYQERLTAAGLRRDHHRDRARRPVLLRRGLPPAVPGQEPERLLRPRRHRRELPGRPGGGQVGLDRSVGRWSGGAGVRAARTTALNVRATRTPAPPRPARCRAAARRLPRFACGFGSERRLVVAGSLCAAVVARCLGRRGRWPQMLGHRRPSWVVSGQAFGGRLHRSSLAAGPCRLTAARRCPDTGALS